MVLTASRADVPEEAGREPPEVALPEDRVAAEVVAAADPDVLLLTLLYCCLK